MDHSYSKEMSRMSDKEMDLAKAANYMSPILDALFMDSLHDIPIELQTSSLTRRCFIPNLRFMIKKMQDEIKTCYLEMIENKKGNKKMKRKKYEL